MRAYSSEADKVRDLPNVMKYITGRIADIGCGHDKITPEAIGYDGRNLPGVDVVGKMEGVRRQDIEQYDTVFSSHFLEHVVEPAYKIYDWHWMLKTGGHLVLYLPEKFHYDSKQNPEHMFDWSYEDFLFWFKRTQCGEGKNYEGDHLKKYFELVDSGLDVGQDRYSFWIVARKV